MDAKYKVVVFGKPGCPKCKVLKQRLGKLLSKDKWADFEQDYYSVKSESGLVNFCEAECINPQRIPAMLVANATDEGGFSFISNPNPEEEDAICGDSKLYQYLGLQTDYTERGRGIISPKMIKSVLKQARGK